VTAYKFSGVAALAFTVLVAGCGSKSSTPTSEFKSSVFTDGTHALQNMQTGVYATIFSAVNNSQDVNSQQSLGDTYMWIDAKEGNSSNGTYDSNPFNFEIQNSVGAVFQETGVDPPTPDNGIARFSDVSLPAASANANSPSNEGWIGFKVPNYSPTYTVLWRESALGSQWHVVCHITFSPAGVTNILRK
jgi:hypothetical protein